MINVRWLGHSCFELEGENKTVLFDPFKGTGLPEPSVKADIILCSHSHADHNNAEPVMKRDSVVLEGFTGSKKIDDVIIKGVATFHDDTKGKARGNNSIYVMNMEDLSFCHLGDLGHDLTGTMLTEILFPLTTSGRSTKFLPCNASSSTAIPLGKVDVLFIPVGGFFTIDTTAVSRTVSALKPKIVVPMHYRIVGMAPIFDPISGVDKFLDGKANVKKLDGPSFSVEKTTLPSEEIIIVPKLS